MDDDDIEVRTRGEFKGLYTLSEKECETDVTLRARLPLASMLRYLIKLLIFINTPSDSLQK